MNYRQLVALSWRQLGGFHEHMLDVLVALFWKEAFASPVG